MRKITFAVLALVLAACGGDSGERAFDSIDQGLAEGGGMTTTTAAAETTIPRGAASDGGAFTVVEFEGQKIIVTGSMEIQAADTRAAMDEITRAVRRVGGRVASAGVGPVHGEERQPEISMVLRIPAEALDGTLSEIRQLAAKVESEQFSSQDVTEEYVDIEARLRNLRTLEDELRALLAEVRTQPNAEPEQLLQIFNEISSVRGQIESLEGRQRYLDDQVAFSTISLFISPLPSSAPIVDEGWQPLVTARDALRSLVSAFQELGDIGIRFVLFALPLIIILTSPFWIAALLWWRSRRKRAAKMGEESGAAGRKAEETEVEEAEGGSPKTEEGPTGSGE